MGTAQLLLLVGAIIIFSLLNLTMHKQSIVNFEIAGEYEVMSNMYKLSKNYNEHHDSTGTYIGCVPSAWLTSNPYGTIGSVISQNEVIMTGTVFITNKEIIGQVTPAGYILQ